MTKLNKKVTWDRERPMNYKAVRFDEVPQGVYFYCSNSQEPHCPCLYIKSNNQSAISLRSGCQCDFKDHQMVIPQEVHIVSRDVRHNHAIKSGYCNIDYENLETHPFIPACEIPPWKHFIFYSDRNKKNPTIYIYDPCNAVYLAIGGEGYDLGDKRYIKKARSHSYVRVIPVNVEMEMHVSF